MSNPATVADIEDRWRPLSAQETINAEAFLDDAWAMLVSHRPTIEDDIAAATVTTGNVVRVLCAMVLRVLKNPSGFVQEAIDDWSGRRADLVASGVLHVTAAELADISPGRASRRSVRLVAYDDA